METGCVGSEAASLLVPTGTSGGGCDADEGKPRNDGAEDDDAGQGLVSMVRWYAVPLGSWDVPDAGSNGGSWSSRSRSGGIEMQMKPLIACERACTEKRPTLA